MATKPFKLGKLPPKRDLRTLKFEDYVIPAQLPSLPDQITWQQKLPADLGEMGNDKIGDCTCAAAGHLIMSWTKNAGNDTKILSDDDIIEAYSAITGYDPTTGLNDNGADSKDVLNYWRTTGIGNDTIEAYTALEYQNTTQAKEAIYLFGGCYIGLQLPNTVLANPDGVWDVPFYGPTGDGAPNPKNGHAVPIVGYDSRYLAFITWGEVKFMTWNFYTTYCDEAYAILSKDWFNTAETNPSGFDLATLQQDLRQIDAE